MIFQLDKHLVYWEVIELSRLQMCEVLKVSTSAIEAKLELADGKMSPEFLVDADECEGVDPDDIREVMKNIYSQCKEELEVRLFGYAATRDQVLEELRSVSEASAGGSI